MLVIKRSGLLEVPKALLDAESVISGLTFEVDGESVVHYEETSTSYLIPRHFRFRKPTLPFTVESVPTNSTDSLKVIYPPLNAIQEAAIEALKGPGDKIVSLCPGAGKTYCAIAAASHADKFPVLVIVKSEFLMDQWKREISRFYGIYISEIGHIQGSVEDWKGKKIALAMIHSLAGKSYSLDFYRNWKLIVIDECHIVGANYLGRAIRHFPGERWGLSATVNRTDGMEKVIHLHLGNIAYANLTQPLKSNVVFVHTGITCDEKKFIRRGNVILPMMLNWLCEIPTRNELVSRYINQCVDQGRSSIILGERINQLHILASQCKSTSKAVYVGGMDKPDAEKALAKQNLFATQHLAKEGLDKPSLDTLFIPVPFGSPGRLQQSVGRIERLHESKKTPVTYVFVDNIPIIKALSRKMERWFQDNNYKVRHDYSATV